MKILVTGCAGFIGGHVVEKLLSDGYDVLGIDCLTYAGDKELMETLEVEHDNFKFITLNIGAIRSEHLTNVDLVVNLAAESHVDNSIANSSVFVQTNVVESHSLIEVCHQSNIPLLHFSTDEVYGVSKTKTFEETDALNPRNPYSATKAAIDHMIFAYQNTYDFKATLIRPSNNFGPRQNGEKFIPTILRSLQEGKKIPVYGKGDQIREWTYVKHTAAAVSFLVGKMIGGECVGEIYNFTTGIDMTNIEMVTRICDGIGVSVNDSVEHVEDRLGHDFRYSITAKKLEGAGFKVNANIEKELRETILFYTEK